MTPVQELIHALESMNKIEVSDDLKHTHNLWLAFAKSLLPREEMMRHKDYLQGHEDHEKDIYNSQYIKDSYGS